MPARLPASHCGRPGDGRGVRRDPIQNQDHHAFPGECAERSLIDLVRAKQVVAGYVITTIIDGHGKAGAIKGRIARRFDRHLFDHVQPRIERHAFHSEWTGGPGVVYEVTLWLRAPMGGCTEHRILAGLPWDELEAP